MSVILSLLLLQVVGAFMPLSGRGALTRTQLSLSSSYLDELNSFRQAGDKKCLLGLATDSWYIGTR